MLAIRSRPTKQNFLDIANAQAHSLEHGLETLSPQSVDPQNPADCDRVLTGLKNLKAKYSTLQEYAHEYKHKDKHRYDEKYPETTVWGIKHQAKVNYSTALKAFTDVMMPELKETLTYAELTFDDEQLKLVEHVAESIRAVHLNSKKKKVEYLDKEISKARQSVNTFFTLRKVYNDVAQSGDVSKLQSLPITPEQFLKDAPKVSNGVESDNVMEERSLQLKPLSINRQHVMLQQNAQNAVSQYSRAVQKGESADSTYAKALIGRLKESEDLLQPSRPLSTRLSNEVKQLKESMKRQLMATREEIQLWNQNGIDYAPEGSSALKRLHSLERKTADERAATVEDWDTNPNTAAAQ